MGNTLTTPEFEKPYELVHRKQLISQAGHNLVYSQRVLRASQLRDYVPAAPQTDTVVPEAKQVQDYAEFVPETPQNDAVTPEKMTIASEENSEALAAAYAKLKEIQG